MAGSNAPVAVCFSNGIGGGDFAAGPLNWRGASRLSAQLRAISLEYTHAELAAATSNFHASKRLGSGCYGAVYRGELKDGSDVAIKAIDLSALMDKGECPEDAGFEDEVHLLSKFRHPHLVTLLGWGQQGLRRYLVYEFLSGGDVFQRLHRCHGGQQGFPWHERLSVLLDAASGLSHMHNATPKAFHRDIKSANILLDRHGAAKMADFGLSCIGQHGATNVTVKTIGGTPGYKCPLYERTRRCTESSEVYSFGMVMLEVMTGLDPSATDPSAPRGIAFPIAQKVAPNTSGALQRLWRHADATACWPWSLFEELAPLALRSVCCPDEEKRPTFVELVRWLKSAVERFPSTILSERADVTQALTCSDAEDHTMAKPDARSQADQWWPSQFRPTAPCVPPDAQQPWHPSSSPSPRTAGGPTPERAKWSPAVQQSPYSDTWQSPATNETEVSLGDPDIRYVLELIESVGCHPEALPAEQRWLPLQPESEGGPSGRFSACVGRNLQGRLFEAWLPNSMQRGCISRSALEISWAENCEDVAILSKGMNPLLLDGNLLPKGSSATLKLGSEITFKYETHVLLRLRFLAFEDCLLTPQWSVQWSLQLTEEEFAQAQQRGATLLPGACRLPEAVERLNSSLDDSVQSGTVAICSSSARHLLYRKQHKDLALAQCGLRLSLKSVRNELTWTPPEAVAPKDIVLQLSCTGAEGLSAGRLAALPSCVRDVGLRGGRNFVGRDYQQQLFEALLCPLECFNVSRCHLCLDVSDHSVQMTNLSSTLEILLGEEHIPKDGIAQLQVGQELIFAKRNGPGFLHLMVFQVKRPADVGIHQEHCVSIAEAVSAQSVAGKAPPAKHDVQAPGSVPPPTRLMPQGKRGQPAHEMSAAQRPPDHLPLPDLGSVSPAVILELSGAGAKDLPVAKRRLGPMTLRKGPWIMGRRHQREFLQAAVKEDCIDFVSRAKLRGDHFAIAFEDCSFFLLALSQNRIWLDRGKMLGTRSLHRDEIQLLRPGDCILLGTSEAGATDSLRLCWRFKLAESLA